MATVTRENIGLLNDKIIVKVAREDYLPGFDKALKQYSKQASIPGFRKGMVPAGIIRKMHGQSVFTDEVLRTVEKELNSYMAQEQLEIFAQPLPLAENDARQIDVNQPAEYSFAFEVGLKPAFSIPDFASLSMTRYKVQVTDEMLQEEIDRLRLRHGKMSEPETVTTEDNVLNVIFTETDASGQVVEGGIRKDNSLLLKYFAPSFREQLLGKKKDDSIILQPASAFETKEREWVMKDLGLPADEAAAAERHFKMTITKLGHVEKAELQEEFFAAAMPGKGVKTEEEFRTALREEIQSYWDKQASNHLQHELYHALLDKTHIDFPELFLKRWMQQSGEQPRSLEEVEQEFPGFLDQLKWTLITDKLVKDQNIEVSAEDIQAFAKAQLFGYMGMSSMDEQQPWIADYVNRMMQDKKFVEDAYHRIQTEKVFGWAETQVNATEKPVTVEEFTKEAEKHQHHHH